MRLRRRLCRTSTQVAKFVAQLPATTSGTLVLLVLMLGQTRGSRATCAFDLYWARALRDGQKPHHYNAAMDLMIRTSIDEARSDERLSRFLLQRVWSLITAGCNHCDETQDAYDLLCWSLGRAIKAVDMLRANSLDAMVPTQFWAQTFQFQHAWPLRYCVGTTTLTCHHELLAQLRKTTAAAPQVRADHPALHALDRLVCGTNEVADASMVREMYQKMSQVEKRALGVRIGVHRIASDSAVVETGIHRCFVQELIPIDVYAGSPLSWRCQSLAKACRDEWNLWETSIVEPCRRALGAQDISGGVTKIGALLEMDQADMPIDLDQSFSVPETSQVWTLLGSGESHEALRLAWESLHLFCAAPPLAFELLLVMSSAALVHVRRCVSAASAADIWISCAHSCAAASLSVGATACVLLSAIASRIFDTSDGVESLLDVSTSCLQHLQHLAVVLPCHPIPELVKGAGAQLRERPSMRFGEASARAATAELQIEAEVDSAAHWLSRLSDVGSKKQND